MSSPRERLAFSRDETSVDPSARSSITPTQSLDSIVRGRALSLEPSQCCLVLAPAREDGGAEERAAIPRSHAEALLAVCTGQVEFECTIVPLGGSKHALLQRFIAPGSLDLLTVEFEDGGDAS